MADTDLNGLEPNPTRREALLVLGSSAALLALGTACGDDVAGSADSSTPSSSSPSPTPSADDGSSAPTGGQDGGDTSTPTLEQTDDGTPSSTPGEQTGEPTGRPGDGSTETPTQRPAEGTTEPDGGSPEDEGTEAPSATPHQDGTEDPSATPGQDSTETPSPTQEADTSTPPSGQDESPTPSSAPCPPMASTPEGSHFRANAPQRSDLNVNMVMGTLLTIKGRVYDTQCNPISSPVLEIWQTNPDGAYDTSEAYEFRGTVVGDNGGYWGVKTLVPGLHDGRARHIHFKISASGHQTLTTQLFFEGDAGNDGDPQVDPSLIMPYAVNSIPVWSIDGFDPVLAKR